MSDVVERFHRALVDEIRSRRPEYLRGPFTVAEIYQNLVPYGTHRDRIGVEMNGDYEDALMRMLTGEGDYLVLESEHALRHLREELEASNPNVGAYREFAAVDVRLNPARIREGGWDRPPAPDPEELAEPNGDLADAEEEAPGLDAVSDPGEPAAAKPEPPDACLWCRAELPKKPNLRFCPFCGTDIRVVPCPACGEELEPKWHFCIACGAEVTG